MDKLNSLLGNNQFITADMLKSIGIIALQLLGVFITAKLLFNFINYLIDNLFDEKEEHDRQTIQRNQTLKTILKSALRYLFYFIIITMALQVLGIPISSILAGAGVFGLAIWFGAQELV